MKIPAAFVGSKPANCYNRAMNFSPLTLYVLAAIFQTAGSSGAAMLAPFFMKDHGYSVAVAGVPLVANGVGRVCSDVMSGIMATYFSAGSILFAAMIIGIVTSIVGYAFMDTMPVFVAAWIGQFYGHKVEGKKPSFFKDLQFLLIGPAWLLHFIYKRLGIPY